MVVHPSIRQNQDDNVQTIGVELGVRSGGWVQFCTCLEENSVNRTIEWKRYSLLSSSTQNQSLLLHSNDHVAPLWLHIIHDWSTIIHKTICMGCMTH